MRIKQILIYLALSISALASSSEIGASLQDWQEEDLYESRKEDNRNEALDYYLSEKQVTLPENNFILIAIQPNGTVSSCIIINLDTRMVYDLPGTHEKRDERIMKLDKSEFDYLTELNSSQLMKNFPSRSGKLGFDGYSLVIYSKSDKTERFISHWGPEYMGLDIFTAIHDHFRNKI